jgi:hypothetical protein
VPLTEKDFKLLNDFEAFMGEFREEEIKREWMRKNEEFATKSTPCLCVYCWILATCM